jgi:hypothetical protein
VAFATKNVWKIESILSQWRKFKFFNVWQLQIRKLSFNVNKVWRVYEPHQSLTMLCTLFTAFTNFARPYSSISTQLSAPQITPHNQYPEVDVFSGGRLEDL